MIRRRTMRQSTRLGLGTIIRITVDHPDSREAMRLSELAFAGIDRIEGLMSAHRADSEVGVLNGRGFCDDVSDDTREVLRKALHYWRITGGAFDVTAFPVRKGPAGQGPDASQPPGRAGSQYIVVQEKHVRFGKEGVGIDLGGIAKGYAVDVAIRILHQNGVRNAVVDAGGDIRAMGNRPDGNLWRIGLADPQNAKRMTSVIRITDAAVATSGTYRRGTPDIIDGRNGKPTDSVTRATVVAPTAVDADALATSVYVLGAEEGIRLIEDLDGVAASVMSRDGSSRESAGWASLRS